MREIQARGCAKLTTLQGLQNCPALEVVGIPMSMLDVTALKGLPTITLAFDIYELGKPKTKGQLVTISKPFIEAINSLPAVKLRLKGPSGSWHGTKDFDLMVLGQFQTVQSLQFDEFDFSCSLEELTWLVQLQKLENLTFYPRGNMSHRLDGGVFDSPRKVKALQLKICQEAKIKPPSHVVG